MVTRFVEDLSRKAGRPQLGRAGWSAGNVLFFDAEHGGPDGAKAAAELHEAIYAHWQSVSADEASKLRREFNRLDEAGLLPQPQSHSVAHFAYYRKG